MKVNLAASKFMFGGFVSSLMSKNSSGLCYLATRKLFT
jgi:hypothetical protein